MEAQDDLGASGMFDPEALGADRHPAIRADFEGGAEAPNIGPPRATRCRTEDGAVFFPGLVPGFLRGHAEFAMGFVGVAMKAQGVDVRVGRFDLGDVFTGEIRREPALPELVLALDFSLGLGCWSIKETNVIKLEGRAELGQSVGVLGEKHGMIIDVDLQRAAVGQESGREEIKVGEEEFSIIEFGGDE